MGKYDSQIIIITKEFLMELGYSLTESSKIIRLTVCRFRTSQLWGRIKNAG